jgi:positive regulator of sigma E activity
MEFEEMQVIWDSQNSEKLYIIDEAALHKQIWKKSQSADRKVNMFEALLIVVNLTAAVVLVIEGVVDGGDIRNYVMGAFYGAFGIFGIVRRLRRRKEARQQFEPTIVGEIDKTIWQVNYLIDQSRSLIIYYLLPLIALFIIGDLVTGDFSWFSLLSLLLIPFSYFGGKWEVNKWYAPKKREMEALRATLTATPE